MLHTYKEVSCGLMSGPKLCNFVLELHAAMTCPSQGHDHEGGPNGGLVISALADMSSREEA